MQLTIPSLALQANTVIVPFEILDGLIIIKAKINSEEAGNFVLDTGANGLVLNAAYFQADRDSKKTGYGISGKVANIGESEIDSLALDELNFYNVTAETINLNQIEAKKKIKIQGLIGYDVLKAYEIMFNYQERYLTFSRVDENGSIIDVMPHTTEKIDSINFTLANHLPVIEVKVNNKVKKMGLDTGAEFNLLALKRNKDIMSEFSIRKKLKIGGADNREREVLAGRLYRVKLGERHQCAGMATVLVNFTYFDQIYNQKLDGMLGFEFFAPWLISINYQKKTLYLHQLKFVKP